MISANGYTLRPIRLSDQEFIVSTLLDFPIKPMSVTQANNEFSNLEYVSRGFNEANVTSDAEVCMVLEFNGTPVSFRFSRFKNAHAEIALLSRHPDERGKGHQNADSFLHGYWYFEHLDCLSCWFEAYDTTAVIGAAAKWRDGTAATETTRPSRFDRNKILRSVTITPDEYRAILAADAVWSNARFAIS